MASRRALIVAAVLLFAAWSAIPGARAYLAVARGGPAPGPVPEGYESVRFASEDGTQLAGWIATAPAGAPAVVLVHGFRNGRRDMLPWAAWLRAAGYGVLLFDTRGVGESGGGTIGLGATEPRDVRAAARLLAERQGTDRVAVLGVSLGAGSAILAAEGEAVIRAVVADSVWPDQRFALDRLAHLRVGPVTVPLLGYGPWVVNALVGSDVGSARPDLVLPRLSPRPVLLVHSADDANATTPLAGAVAMREAAANADLWVAPRGGHAGALLAQPVEYRARVLDFLGAALTTPRQ